MLIKNKITLSLLCSYAIFAIENNFVSVSFDDSMATSYMHDPVFANYNPPWQLVRQLYTKYMITEKQIATNPRIPKIIHQIWLGSPFPEKYKAFTQSWLNKHPGWQYKLWTDADVPMFNMKNIKLFNKTKNWGQKSDIWRLEILDRYGGLYIDTDFQCLKSIDILHHMCDFYIGLAHSKTVVFYNGLIGAAPGHPIIKRCIETISLKSGANEEDAIQKSTGPHFVTKCFLEVAPKINSRSVALPITFFYPFPNSHRIYSNNPETVKSYIRPESYCVHLWEYSWSKNKK